MLGSVGAITAPALIVVGSLMATSVRKIPWDDFTEAFPAFVTIVAMPFSHSIAEGLALGFISYPLVKLIGGRPREVHPLIYVLAAVLVLRYVFL
jgi:AGZA family xanthine/uracil permease-like MFS transporter